MEAPENLGIFNSLILSILVAALGTVTWQKQDFKRQQLAESSFEQLMSVDVMQFDMCPDLVQGLG